MAHGEHFTPRLMLNVYRAFFSLHGAGRLIMAHQAHRGMTYTHVVAARPDTAFLSRLVWRPFGAARGGVRVPNFMHWGGINDRFAYGDNASMLGAYMPQLPGLMRSGGVLTAFNTERFLCAHLAARRVRLGVTPICLARVHAGRLLREDILAPRERPACRGLASFGGLFAPSASDLDLGDACRGVRPTLVARAMNLSVS